MGGLLIFCVSIEIAIELHGIPVKKYTGRG